MDGRTTDISRSAEIAASKGILVVNAVGNYGVMSWHYLIAPADVHGDSLIAVGAVDSLGFPADFSSFGPSADGRIKPDLVAQGVANALVSASGNPTSYTSSNGTSFSTPLVTGLAACLMQRHPLWTPREVIRALRETASHALRPDNQRGYGMPDGRAASRWPDVGPPPPASTLGIQLIGPNPFHSRSASVLVRIASGGQGTLPGELDVMDLNGRRVRELWSGTLVSGRWDTVSWDGTDGDGRRVPAGAYYIALRAGGEVSSVRLVALD
jgi:subtilisin family serine protease